MGSDFTALLNLPDRSPLEFSGEFIDINDQELINNILDKFENSMKKDDNIEIHKLITQEITKLKEKKLKVVKKLNEEIKQLKMYLKHSSMRKTVKIDKLHHKYGHPTSTPDEKSINKNENRVYATAVEPTEQLGGGNCSDSVQNSNITAVSNSENRPLINELYNEKDEGKTKYPLQAS